MKYILMAGALATAGLTTAQETDRSWKLYNPFKSKAQTDTTQAKAMPETAMGDTALVDSTLPVVQFQADSAKGTVHVYTNPMLDTLMVGFNKSQLRPGYRIQIHRGSSSQEARMIKTKYLQKRDDQKVYDNWAEPNFKVLVGNFRSYIEASRYLQGIKEDYPAAYILRDMIEPAELTPITLPTKE